VRTATLKKLHYFHSCRGRSFVHARLHDAEQWRVSVQHQGTTHPRSFVRSFDRMRRCVVASCRCVVASLRLVVELSRRCVVARVRACVCAPAPRQQFPPSFLPSHARVGFCTCIFVSVTRDTVGRAKGERSTSAMWAQRANARTCVWREGTDMY